MKKALIGLILIAAFALPVAPAWSFTTAERVAIGEELIRTFRHRYAPLQYKIDTQGLDFSAANERLLTKLKEAGTDLAMYDALKRYVASFKDAHVSLLVPSNYQASLGVYVDLFGGRYIITHIDREVLESHEFPFEIGDELLSIDGESPDLARSQLEVYHETGHAEANARIATWGLASRAQAVHVYVPTGESVWEIYSQARGSSHSVALQWKHEGEPLTETKLPTFSAKRAIALMLSEKSNDRASSLHDLSAPYASGAQLITGTRKPFFAMGEHFVERNNDPMISGIFLHNNSRIGYIRFRTWMYEESDEEILGFVERELRYLEQHTDALLIDQTMNNGGWMHLGAAVASMFLDETVSSPLMRFRATKSDLLNFEAWLHALEPDDDWYDLALRIVSCLRAALEQGMKLTEAFGVSSPDEKLHPFEEDGSALYSHPVLLITNELSCSMGDIFPIMMQDQGVPIMGERTMGCGGGVQGQEKIGVAEIDLNLTRNLITRAKPTLGPNGQWTRYIENVGVIPDIPYELGYEDYLDDYTSFRDAALNELHKMIEAAKE